MSGLLHEWNHLHEFRNALTRMGGLEKILWSLRAAQASIDSLATAPCIKECVGG